MRVELRQVGAVAFEASGDSGGRALLEGSADLGGEGRGMRPTEALLSALGTCSAIDVLYILRKQKEPIEDLQVEIEGERADEVPARFTKIHLRFVAKGEGLNEKKVARAVRLSVEKYCSVGASLREDIEVTHEAVIT